MKAQIFYLIAIVMVLTMVFSGCAKKPDNSNDNNNSNNNITEDCWVINGHYMENNAAETMVVGYYYGTEKGVKSYVDETFETSSYSQFYDFSYKLDQYSGCNEMGGRMKKGTLVFYTKDDWSGGTITINLPGIGSANVTQKVDYGSCYSPKEGSAVFTDVPLGKYKYTASCSKFTLNGEITHYSDCQDYELPISSEHKLGTVLFYADDYLHVGSFPITVTLSGVGTAYITQHTGFSTCNYNTEGCAIFSVPYGEYKYTASCSTRTWEAMIIVDDRCETRCLLF